MSVMIVSRSWKFETGADFFLLFLDNFDTSSLLVEGVSGPFEEYH